MKGLTKKINGNAGVVSAVILVLGFLITWTSFIVFAQAQTKKQIDESPRLQRIEFNLKNLMNSQGLEYID